MDPFSAILIIGIMTVAGAKTAGSAVTDGIAQARGQTPPSLEKWRANQEKRHKRGERPAADPGGLKRIWNNQMEAAAAKSAYKHQGRMQYLDDHGEEIAEGKRRRLENAAHRRQIVGGKLAVAGGSSWNALRTVAGQARRGHTSPDALDDLEDEAWAENRRRDAERRTVEEDQGQDTGPDADVLPFGPRLAFIPREDGNLEVRTRGTDDPDDGTNIRGDASDPATWQGTDRHGRDIQTGRGPSHDTGNGIVHDSDEYLLGEDVSPERRIVTARRAGRQVHPPAPQTTDTKHDQARDPEHDWVPDPDSDTGQMVSVAELQRRRAAEQAQADREHTERLAQIHQPVATAAGNTDTGGNDMQPSATEITDLETAELRAQDSSKYAGKVETVLSDQIEAIQAALQGMKAEAQMQEGASGSLSGEGFNTKITGRFDNGAESYHNAVSALDKVVQALQHASEEVSTAQGQMRSASKFFASQQGISEAISANGQNGGVAKRTDFYANA